ncbi:MAG TPA: hypothetical protein V6D22_26305 [Candidatus Obscuribacterales bacterium]
MNKLAVALAMCLVVGAGTVNPASAQSAHPKLKKYAAVAGVGALTGGLGGIILGSGMAAGAATGAGTHVGFHALKDWWHRRKARESY